MMYKLLYSWYSTDALGNNRVKYHYSTKAAIAKNTPYGLILNKISYKSTLLMLAYNLKSFRRKNKI